MELPVIDVSPLLSDNSDTDRSGVARQIDSACRTNGFFQITGHGIDPDLQARLETAAHEFFALPEAEKTVIAMREGGRAWRGWFPLGGELTAGVPDNKEGLYFGAELGDDHALVAAGTPLHGPNLFPSEPADLRSVVLEWIAAMTKLAATILGGIALGLGLDGSWFKRELTADPLVLFRIFRYPPLGGVSGDWGVAEHTDYGLLTILAQDDSGGLQVRSRNDWIEVPPTPGTFVCNIGDMLDRMTAGRYRSTPHRVDTSSLGPTAAARLSFPFFFDPGWDAQVAPIPLPGEPPADDSSTRWDNTSLHSLSGTYGDYLLSKVSKVFPQLS